MDGGRPVVEVMGLIPVMVSDLPRLTHNINDNYSLAGPVFWSQDTSVQCGRDRDIAVFVPLDVVCHVANLAPSVTNPQGQSVLH